ncbi:MAG: hypothetical protein K2X27_01840 [Candidatus Obscuribacterales bacterium]|nr:hypothetical protein [Candidatus Obscuribacterales bacterium]
MTTHVMDLYCRSVSLYRQKDVSELHRLAAWSKEKSKLPFPAFERSAEIQGLRQTLKHSARRSMPLFERLRKFFSELSSSCALTGSRTLLSRTCVNYGHEIDQAGWKSGLPNCIDCGAIINGPEELRKYRRFPGESRDGRKFWTEPVR